MGQAIIIKNINFSSFNIGTVHRQGQPIPVTGISILGSSIVTNSATYSVSYIPSNTTQLGVTWSIVNGSTYASIDSQTGELTVLDGASSNNVKIRATSIFNQSIYGELDIVVSKAVIHDCSMEVSLINGDFTLHDWDNGVDIQPDHAGYLSSNSNGTSFNRTVGHGIVYDDMTHLNFKSYSFECYIDTTKSGSLNNAWGGIFGYNLTRSNNYPLAMVVSNRYPDNGWRFTGIDDTKAIDVTNHSSAGVWHKICVVSDMNTSKMGDGTAGNYYIKAYVDGVLVGTQLSYPYVDPHAGGFVLDHIVLILGNSWRLFANGYTSTDVNPLCGTLRNIRMFRRELTEQEAINESTLN